MGASWVSENILATHPDADFKVYAVWVPALPTDSRAEWNPYVLPDDRVAHFWDGEFAIGNALGNGNFGGVVYDVYAVYDAEARWGDAPVAQGGTVIGDADRLRGALVPLLDDR